MAMRRHAAPEINAKETLAKEKINATQHFTEPPPRYSEASLIKKMEELGIGRPSTYTSTLADASGIASMWSSTSAA
jgi:DNA topoisomerase IA